ncbi:MAG: cytochrome P450 [Pseudonocardiales bacterium]|nr:cytochrome P450 [Pseudonocardiales bacterium]MBV9729687.1 cytochrome P450 [Pseudonocardiales bacterium]
MTRATSRRARPGAWAVTRITTTDTHLDGHPIRAGSTIVCSAYLLHHRPDLYPDSDRFDPDRRIGGHSAHSPQSAPGRFSSPTRASPAITHCGSRSIAARAS